MGWPTACYLTYLGSPPPCKHALTSFKMVISFVCLLSVRPLLASMAVLYHENRELKQRWRRRQREGHKSNRFRMAKQQLCTCITLFCKFLCCQCTTTTWKCLISRFVEVMNRRQQLSLSFPILWHNPLEFNSRKICRHLTNWTRWNKRDKVWYRANSLFKWRFVAVAVVVAEAP